MKPYPKYKDSGVEWLGRVPEGWEVRRFKEFLKERDERSLSGNEALLSVSAYTGVTPRSDTLEAGEFLSRAESLEGYKVCYAGDLVMNIMLAWNRGQGVTKFDGIVSPSYAVFASDNTVDIGFLNYLIRSNEYCGYFKSFSAGVIDSRLRLYPEKFGALACIFPPLPEQQAIAAFLDRETAKIDGLIAEQRRLIALLAEKRQATISHAVTRGLNPNARLKPSGVDWLGDVPEGWEVVPLKYLVSFHSGGTPSKERPEFWDGDIPWASAKDLKAERLSDTILHISEAAVSQGGSSLQPVGSVVVLVRGMTLAKSFPVCLLTEAMAINQDLKALRCTPQISSEFLAHALRGLSAESLSRIDEAGHGTKALRMEAWVSIELPVPPQAEQMTIACWIDARTTQLDALAETATRAIDLLQERRAALISAAVTGKIDVRDTATAEPEAA